MEVRGYLWSEIAARVVLVVMDGLLPTTTISCANIE